MLSFLTHPPHRTDISSQNPITSADGAVTTYFVTPEKQGQEFCIRQIFHMDKLKEIRKAGKDTYIIPPYNVHWGQTEVFIVEKGSLTAILDGKHVDYKEGEFFLIKSGMYHTFTVDASQKENMVLVVKPEKWEDGMDEKFFRNLFGYLDDCYRAKVQPNLFQLLLILYDSETSIVIPKVPKFMGKFLGRWLLGFVGGKIIGQRLLGFQPSYKEYYVGTPDVTKKTK